MKSFFEASKNFHEKWNLFVNDLKEHCNISFYEVCLGFLLLSMGVLLLVIAYAVFFNGGLEYNVKIGRV